ncbi:MAG: hypothetical protein AAF138_00110 [Planctomycetota bacterium]
MRTLGSYQLEERLLDRGPVSVYRAEARDGRTVRLRVFEPAALFAGEASAALWAARLIESGRLQSELGDTDGNKASSTTGTNWAGVVESGRAKGLAFVATDWADTSLGAIVEGCFTLDARSLRPIAAGIVRGLQHYHHTHGRAMDSLGFDTVLIERFSGGELKVGADGSGVLLTDPTPMPRPVGRAGGRAARDATASAEPKHDTAALGRLLWRVIERKDEGTPVPPTASAGPAWKGLGRSGEAWRELVNTLIDPRALERGSLPDLESIAQALPHEPFDWRKPAGVVGGVAAAAAIGVAIWQFTPETTPEQRDIAAGQLIELVRQNDDWLEDVKAQLAPRLEPGATPEPGALPPGLAAYAVYDTETVEAFDRLRDELGTLLLEPMAAVEQPPTEARPQSVFDPLRYASPWEGTNDDLIEKLRAQRAAALRAGPQRRPEVLRRIEEISALSLELRTKVQAWSGPRLAERWADEYDGRGWGSLSEDLLRRAEAWDTAPAPKWDRMEPLLEAAAAVEQIEALQEASDRLVEVADRRANLGLERKAVVVQNAIARSTTASEALVNAAGQREEVDQLIALAEDPDDRIDWDALAASDDASSVGRLAARGDFQLWIREVNQYARLAEDPRPTEAWGSTIEEMRARVEIVRAKEGFDVAEQMERDIAEAVALVAEAGSLPAVVASEERLREAAADASEAIADADAKTTRAVQPYLQTPEQYIAERTNESFRSPGLDSQWRAHLSGRSFANAQDPAYTAFFNRTNWLLDQFRRLDDEAVFCRVTPAPGGGEADGGVFDAAGYLAAVRTEREQRVAELGARFVASIGEPERLADAEVIAERNGVRESFDAWQVGALTIAREAVWIRDRLVEAYRLDEPAAGDSARTIEAVLASIESGDASYDGVRRSISGVAELVAGVRAVRDAGTVDAARAALAAGGTNAGANARLTQAWRWCAALADVSGDGAGVDPIELLDFAAQVRTGLISWAESGAPGSRLDAVRGSVAQNAPAIWRAAAMRAADGEVFGDIVSRRGDFDITVAGLTGDLWWRARSTVLVREELRGIADDNRARLVVQAFMNETRPRGDLPSWAPQTPLYQAADQLSRNEEPEAKPEEIGPAIADWVFDGAAAIVPGGGRPPEKLVYRMKRRGRNTSDLVLTFRLVSGPGEVPVLVSDQEVSVSVALWAMNNALGRSRADFQETLKTPGGFVQSWTRDEGRGRISRADAWLPEQGLDRDREPIAPGMPESAGKPPTEQHPMQYLGPHSAMALAQGLGCRLPTVSEFRAAMRTEYPMYAPGNGGALRAAMDQGALGSNLRRGLWREQHEYAQGNVGDPAAAAVQDDGGSDWNGADGALWFREVDDGPARGGARGTLTNLIGNVAEWVIADGSQDLFEVNPDDPQAPDLEALWQALQTRAGVMGHSAMTPAVGAGAVDQPLGPAGGGRGDLTKIEMNIGYSDVGFRLAIAPRGRWGTVEDWLAERLEESLRLAQR